MSVLALAARLLFWGAASAALAGTGALVARRALGTAERVPFLAASLAAATALYLTLFFASGALGVFSLASVGAGALAAWTIAERLWGGAAARSEIGKALGASARQALAVTRRFPGALALAPVLLVAPLALRALVGPPLAWDALTYHLVRAARWLQTGSWAPVPGPDAVGYYEHFAPGGDALWAWMLAATHSDTLLVLATVGAFFFLVFAVYALARELGGAPPVAAAVAGATGSLPAALRFATTAYVDDLASAWALVGTLFLLRFLRTRRSGDALFALFGFALLSDSKSMSFPALGFAAAVVLARSGSLPRARLRRRLLPALAPLALAAAPLVWGVVWTGSWSAPFEARILGRTLAHGDPAFVHALAHPLVPPDNLEFLLRLFRGRAFPTWPHLNFGWGGALLAGLGAVTLLGAALQPARHGARWRSILVLGLALWPLAAVFSPQLAALRSPLWWDVNGRLLLQAPALAAAAVALLPATVAAPLCALAIALDLLSAWPLGFTLADLAPAAAPLTVVAVLALALAVFRRRLAGGERRLVAGAVVASLLAAVIWIDALRATRREVSYRRALDDREAAFDAHPIQVLAPPGAAAVWAHLDGDRPLSVAASWGWDLIAGQNWCRYPLLGSRLQNRLLYVPPTRDGRIVSYADGAKLAAAADPESWLARLRSAKVDLLVCGYPWSLECRWAMADPRRFPLEIAASSRALAAFRVAPAP
ncbi:MAG: hypothetical protein U0X73_15225 [Thermoanaerobaculia bacterium]